jgi:dihydrofolate synthase / folylpolyglutamate synthase
MLAPFQKPTTLEPMDRLEPRYTQSIRYLYDRINYEKTLDRPYNQQTYRLARMEFLLNELGNPHLHAPVIHVAGTKGKGSVSWFLAEGLRFAGKKVGLYTSPHLLHLEERFVVDGVASSPSQVAEHIESLERADHTTTQSVHGQPTFFEMTTALAWSLFSNQGTDVNIIEVGLGGRLDSTNVCNSSLSIITPISLDHQQQLGSTIELIAAEKAGIIKHRTPVISGARHPDARKVIRSTCEKNSCELWEIESDFATHCTPDLITKSRSFSDAAIASKSHPMPLVSHLDFLTKNRMMHPLSRVPIRMAGAHQAENAAIALAAWQRLQHDGVCLPTGSSDEPILRSLATTQLSCRTELVCDRPMVLIDSAHNIASIEALIRTIERHYRPTKKTIVFACSRDKDYAVMLEMLCQAFDRIILTQFHNNPRSVPVERLEQLGNTLRTKYPKVELLSAPSSDIATSHALRTVESDELICVAGSFFLASEVRPLFMSPSDLSKP